MIVTHFGPLNPKIFSLAVAAFRGGALFVKLLLSIRLTINLNVHPAASLNVDMLDTAAPFSKLLAVVELSRLSRKQLGTT